MYTALIPAFGRQRQVDLCEFEVSLVYKVSSKTGSKATQRNPVSGGAGGWGVLVFLLVFFCFFGLENGF